METPRAMRSELLQFLKLSFPRRDLKVRHLDQTLNGEASSSMFVTSPEPAFGHITVKLNFGTERQVGMICVPVPSARSASEAKLYLHLREFHGEELTLQPKVE